MTFWLYLVGWENYWSLSSLSSLSSLPWSFWCVLHSDAWLKSKAGDVLKFRQIVCYMIWLGKLSSVVCLCVDTPIDYRISDQTIALICNLNDWLSALKFTLEARIRDNSLEYHSIDISLANEFSVVNDIVPRGLTKSFDWHKPSQLAFILFYLTYSLHCLLIHINTFPHKLHYFFKSFEKWIEMNE